jgi:hypothetical protein
MEEMEKFWKHGVEMWDEYRRETFTLKAIIFVTINDYPALFSLSGQKKGKTGCVVCLNGTISAYLKGSQKTVYMGHPISSHGVQLHHLVIVPNQSRATQHTGRRVLRAPRPEPV